MAIDHSTSAHPKTTRKRRKNHSIRNKRRTKRGMQIDLDAIARQEVFERDGHRCIFAGMFGITCGAGLQWCHVLSRRHAALRWMQENAFTGCAGHHLYWHHEPAVAVARFIEMYPERWRILQAVHLANPKVDVRALWQERVK